MQLFGISFARPLAAVSASLTRVGEFGAGDSLAGQPESLTVSESLPVTLSRSSPASCRQ